MKTAEEWFKVFSDRQAAGGVRTGTPLLDTFREALAERDAEIARARKILGEA